VANFHPVSIQQNKTTTKSQIKVGLLVNHSGSNGGGCLCRMWHWNAVVVVLVQWGSCQHCFSKTKTNNTNKIQMRKLFLSNAAADDVDIVEGGISNCGSWHLCQMCCSCPPCSKQQNKTTTKHKQGSSSCPMQWLRKLALLMVMAWATAVFVIIECCKCPPCFNTTKQNNNKITTR